MPSMIHYITGKQSEYHVILFKEKTLITSMCVSVNIQLESKCGKIVTKRVSVGDGLEVWLSYYSGNFCIRLVNFKLRMWGQAWQHMPIIPALREAEVGGS